MWIPNYGLIISFNEERLRNLFQETEACRFLDQHGGSLRGKTSSRGRRNLLHLGHNLIALGKKVEGIVEMPVASIGEYQKTSEVIS
jgi:hypothetical protein